MKTFESLSKVNIPLQIYGTAWKEERTSDLVYQALQKGFRGIDTACQPKHYNEKQVGEGLLQAYATGLKRSDLFIQTKFTPFNGQDSSNCPYDPSLALEDQLEQSLLTSLENLKTDYLDSLILHSPLATWEDNIRAWNSLESFVQDKKVKQIGISNCYSLELFTKLFAHSSIKPSVLQNRFYPDSNYDKLLREFCRERGVYYQSFWTVNANTHIWQNPFVEKLALQLNKSPIQIYFRALIQEQVYPLYGTTNSNHMEQVMELFEFKLSKDECTKIKNIGPY